MPAPLAVGADYDAIAREFDARMWADARTRARFHILDGAQRRAVAGRARVLELGCATARLLAGVDAPLRVGIDVSAGLLLQARRRGIHVLRADAHRLPFAAASFDAVLAGVSVFRYLDYARALGECARVLAPGGVLSLHVQAGAPWSPRELVGRSQPDPLDAASLDDVRAPAIAAGLAEADVRVWRSVRFWPYLLPLPLPSARLPLWHHALFTFIRR